MKRLTTIIVLFFTLCVSAQSESREEREERLKALKVSYFTDKLELTEIEAQKFWPIYNTYEQKLRQLRRDLRTSRKEESNSKEASKELVALYISYDEQKLGLLKTLVSDLETAISYDKILKMMRAEEGFRRRLIEQYRKRRQERNEQRD